MGSKSAYLNSILESIALKASASKGSARRIAQLLDQPKYFAPESKTKLTFTAVSDINAQITGTVSITFEPLINCNCWFWVYKYSYVLNSRIWVCTCYHCNKTQIRRSILYNIIWIANRCPAAATAETRDRTRCSRASDGRRSADSSSSHYAARTQPRHLQSTVWCLAHCMPTISL